MEKLNTIQKRNNLNAVYRAGYGPGCAYYDYYIYPADCDPETTELPTACIEFQTGPRCVDISRDGVMDSDLLEVVRDRLKDFQSCTAARREYEMALMHIEEALMWMNRLVEDRAERQFIDITEK